jgi:hypothetical protein
MSRRDEHKRQITQAGSRYREEAESDVAASIWDQDPIKQYVRRRGWRDVIETYINAARQAGIERPLKFLTLPGPNATDIGFLWNAGLIQRTESGTLSVAICDKKHADVVATQLGDVGGVLAYSRKCLHEALEDPHDQVRETFPFDVINMDLENPLIPPNHRENLKAVESIFRLQRGQQFLLLLTTRPEPAAANLLLTSLETNLRDEELFEMAYRERYGDLKAEQFSQRKHTEFTQLVVPKIVARLARPMGYKTLEHYVGHYSRKGGYDMICHSFEFEPITLKAEASKYAPRYKEPDSMVEEALHDIIGPRVTNKANIEYSEFVSMLPLRSSEDVVATLVADAALKKALGEEANSLVGWWTKAKLDAGQE